MIQDLLLVLLVLFCAPFVILWGIVAAIWTIMFSPMIVVAIVLYLAWKRYHK